LRNFPEAFILHRPKDIVSGDFYWFHGGNGHGEFMSAVGDCTGHGVSGALLSMIGYNLLNDIVGDDNLLTNPTDILSELDLGICKLLKQDTEPGYQDGIDMSFVTINKKEKKIYFCGCKRPLLYLVRNEKKISVYKGEPYLVGGTDTRHEKTFKTQEIDYIDGDIIYMSTDGYTDQFGGDRNRKFMKDKFSDMLLDIQHLNLCYQSQLLEQKIIKWQGDLEQTDDILVVGIKL
jgi:serine phosphatase RsbU (regulator of sigma subunit)